MAWLGGMTVLLAATVELSLPVIGVSRRALARARSRRASPLPPPWRESSRWPIRCCRAIGTGSRLAMLVPLGIFAYAALLFVFARADRGRSARLIRPAGAAVQTL